MRSLNDGLGDDRCSMWNDKMYACSKNHPVYMDEAATQPQRQPNCLFTDNQSCAMFLTLLTTIQSPNSN